MTLLSEGLLKDDNRALLMSGLGGPPTFQDLVLADAPYLFVTGTDDLVANHDISVTGATTGVTGPLGNTALSFDGTNDVGSIASVDLADTTTITVETVMKWDAYADDDDLFLEFTSNWGLNQGGFVVDMNNSTGGETSTVSIGYESIAAGNIRGTFPRAGLTAATWHHFVIILTQVTDGLDVYVDGVKQTVTMRASGILEGDGFANATLNLFCRNQGSLFGAGDLAAIAIYKSALTGSQITTHYGALTL